MANRNLSIHLLFKNQGWTGSTCFPFFTIIVATKIIGTLGSILLILLILVIKSSKATISIKIPEIHIPANYTAIIENHKTPTEIPIIATLYNIPSIYPTRTVQNSNTPLDQKTVTPLVKLTENSPQTILSEGVSTFTFRPLPTLTGTTPQTPTGTTTLTPTLTFTPTNTPFVSQFMGKMHTPLGDIPFEDLQSIISQPFIQGIEPRDIGHYAVDLGSYDYKGQQIYDWPIQAVFSGKVAGLVNDRQPLGYAIVIESQYDQIPEEVKQIVNIKPNQSLYHLYAHMIQLPILQLGQAVNSGEQIGYVGKSKTVEAHLHFETRIGPADQVFPNLAYYTGDVTPEEKADYERFRMSGEFKSFDPMILFNIVQR